eukprot:4942004-Prymnesium_polylepis.1
MPMLPLRSHALPRLAVMSSGILLRRSNRATHSEAPGPACVHRKKRWSGWKPHMQQGMPIVSM